MFPNGYIPRIENRERQFNFLSENDAIEYIMFDIQTVNILLRQGHDSSSFLHKFNASCKIITTSTIQDQDLLNYHYDIEKGLIQEFRPHYHIPCDCPIYFNDFQPIRLHIMTNYIKELEQFMVDMSDSNTTILPLIKGASPKEKKLMSTFLENHGFTSAVYYARQYFGGPRGCSKRKLNLEIREIIANSPIDQMMIIGVNTPYVLRDLPPHVVSIAGMKWIQKSNLNNETNINARNNYILWKEDIEALLGRGNGVIEKRRD